MVMKRLKNRVWLEKVVQWNKALLPTCVVDELRHSQTYVRWNVQLWEPLRYRQPAAFIRFYNKQNPRK